LYASSRGSLLWSRILTESPFHFIDTIYLSLI
jgi:hypothetical protein